MVHTSYLIFEFAIYGLFLMCLWNARKNPFLVAELFAAAFFGVLLEQLTIQQAHAYKYGRFLIMLNDTPLAVGVGWSTLIYSSMRYAELFDMPLWGRPFLCALIGLNIDFVLDPIAGRMGMWTWTNLTPTEQYFGVLWFNFWSWFIVIASFTGFLWLLRPWREHNVGRWLYIPAAILSSLVILVVSNAFTIYYLEHIGSGAAPTLLLLAAGIVIVFLSRPHMQAQSNQPYIMAVPAVFIGLSVVCGLYFGYYQESPLLGLITAIMVVVAIAIQTVPFLQRNPSPLANNA